MFDWLGSAYDSFTDSASSLWYTLYGGVKDVAETAGGVLKDSKDMTAALNTSTLNASGQSSTASNVSGNNALPANYMMIGGVAIAALLVVAVIVSRK